MIDIRRAVTGNDFEVAASLIDSMAEWDIKETQKRGLLIEDLIATVYSHTPATLQAKFDQPNAGLFVARFNGDEAGCLGFARLEDGSGEVQKLFVDPKYRGKGIARTLMARTLKEMDRVGFRLARLETVSFMNDAIALYNSFGFVSCQPYRSTVAGLDAITVYMERHLKPRVLPK